jgi:hypothetical protein
VEKIFDLGKTDTAPNFAMLRACVDCNFQRAQKNKNKFSMHPKTSIPSAFSKFRKNRAVSRFDPRVDAARSVLA